MAGVVDPDHHEVFALDQFIRHVKAERGETAHVFAQVTAVEVDVAQVIDGPEVEELAASLVWFVVEIFLKPHAAFVEEEAVVLGVPIAGHSEHGGRFEAVFHQFGGISGLLVAAETAVIYLHAVVVVTVVEGVDDVVPGTVEGNRLPGIDVLQHRVAAWIRGNGQ